ncbi:putative pentatricopeptide repeat-containing protein [Senna tora]|uniref:Putative pentatricopeptide repeat-containing protein n=1 Tax=Senna tora TaxID=362788 RepID=A0A834SF70_9FABA|nr:putative pentatricopeptide repeat-containing protein [Senna tora]
MPSPLVKPFDPWRFDLHDVKDFLWALAKPANQTNNQYNPEERCVLEKLSDLLPISRNNTTSITLLNHHKSEETQLEDCNSEKEMKSVDGFLLPEEKLRGIFLQKLKGKTTIERALSDVDVDMNVEVLDKVVSLGNLSGEAMVTFFNWAIKQPMVPKDIDSYRVIIKALGRRKFFKFMMELLYNMKMEGIRPDLSMLSIVIDSFVKAGHVSKASQIFSNLDDIGLECDTEALNVFLLCLCRRSRVGAATSIFHSMKGKIPFNNTTYNVIVGGWSKFGRVNEIERIRKEMEADGFTPNCTTFNYVLEGLGRAGRMNDAVEIFHNMKKRNYQPDIGTYNAMIFNCLSVKDFDECIKYYKIMLSDNCEPNVDTYTRIITAFLKARKVADALQMFDDMLSRGFFPSTGIITSILKYLCSYGPPYAALMIYKKARKVGCVISLDAYKLLLMRLSKFGKCGMMLSTWEDMQKCGHTTDMEVYEYIISGLCNIGQLENAALVMEECLRKGFCPSRLVYSKLSNKLLASNKVDRAYNLFLKIKGARSRENARKYWRANGWHF